MATMVKMVMAMVVMLEVMTRLVTVVTMVAVKGRGGVVVGSGKSDEFFVFENIESKDCFYFCFFSSIMEVTFKKVENKCGSTKCVFVLISVILLLRI